MTNDRIAAFALEIGAARIADDARASEASSPRELCRRLEHHVTEHQRALLRSPEEVTTWTNGLMLARILADRVIDKRRKEPDAIGEQLERWLARERRKFLMSTKVDALGALRTRFETATLRDLRQAGPEAAFEIADELARRFHTSLLREVRAATSAVAARLVRGLQETFNALPTVIPPDCFAGLDLAPLRTYRIVRVRAAEPGPLGQLAERLTGRSRIISRVETQLVAELERASAMWVREAEMDFADATDAVERRFCALLDAAVETGKTAALFADRARRQGLAGLAEARVQLAQWSALLAELVAHPS